MINAPAVRTRPLWLLGTALAVLAVHTNWHVPLAAWLFPVLLLRYSRLNPTRKGQLRVWLALVVAALFWLAVTGLLFVPAALLAFLFFTVLQWAPYFLDRLLVPRLASGLVATLVFPLGVVTGEFLFALVVRFGDYGALGSTQYGNLPLLQLASVTGVYGISFLVAWFASVLNWAWEHGFRWPSVRRGALVYLGVLAVVLGAGAARLLLFAPTAQTVRVAGISATPTADDATKDALTKLGVKYWVADEVRAADPTAVRTAFAPVTDELLARTRQEAQAGAKIILWPETQARVLDRDRPELLRQAGAMAKEYDVYIDLAFALYTDQAPYIRNITTLVTPDGTVAWTYDKTHPTPMEPMTPGEGNVPVADSRYGRLSNVICYDADYPDLMRQAADKDTDLMLVPANDWAGFEDLHARKAILRAVENGYSMVRHSVHGVSTAVDPQGRVLAEADYFRTDRQTLVASIPLQPRTWTIYSSVGDVFAWLCLVALAGVGVVAMARRAPRGPLRAG